MLNAFEVSIVGDTGKIHKRILTTDFFMAYSLYYDVCKKYGVHPKDAKDYLKNLTYSQVKITSKLCVTLQTIPIYDKVIDLISLRREGNKWLSQTV